MKIHLFRSSCFDADGNALIKAVVVPEDPAADLDAVSDAVASWLADPLKQVLAIDHADGVEVRWIG